MHINKKILIISTLLTSLIISLAASASAGAANRIHFLKNEDIDGGDAIVIESNGRYGLIDAMSPTEESGKAWSAKHDNGKKVRTYIKELCDKAGKANNCSLDFFIATHNHSDHIGGVPEIAEYINNKTIVFYKEPMGGENFWENLERDGSNRNMSFYEDMLTAFDKGDKSPILCNVSNCSSAVYGGTRHAYINPGTHVMEDSISFTFGIFDIDLYNLYHPYVIKNNNDPTQSGENANSIVARISTKYGTRIALMGDIYTTSRTSDNIQIEERLANVIGEVDIVKAAHHGISDTSNSFSALDTLNPSEYIITRGVYEKSVPNNTLPPVAYLTKNKRNSNKHVKVYYTGHSKSGAVIINVDKSGYSIGSDDSPELANTNVVLPNGWIGTKYNWYYLYKGAVLINQWHKTDGKWYYLGRDGKMVTGWLYDNKKWYYLDTDGIMLANTSRTINGKTYNFSASGECTNPY